MAAKPRESERCALCERTGLRLTRHHLIPQSRERHAGIRRSDPAKAVAWLCGACHRHIHAVLTEKELQRAYSTLAALRAHPEIQRFVAWIRRKPPGLLVRSRTQRGR